jgi:hypothetical protein
MTNAPNAQPYGPATAVIRTFLVQLASLERAPHDEIIASYHALSMTSRFDSADQQLSEAITRSGRTDARDALFGPFLQLMRERHLEADGATPVSATPSSETGDAPDDAIELDPIAESALAALMALLVHDLLPHEVLATLYAPYEPYVPLATVIR